MTGSSYRRYGVAPLSGDGVEEEKVEVVGLLLPVSTLCTVPVSHIYVSAECVGLAYIIMENYFIIKSESYHFALLPHSCHYSLIIPPLHLKNCCGCPWFRLCSTPLSVAVACSMATFCLSFPHIQSWYSWK